MKRRQKACDQGCLRGLDSLLSRRLRGAPRQVFQTDFIDTLGRSYDVSSDGQSLYVVKQPDPPDGTRVHVVTGWAP